MQRRDLVLPEPKRVGVLPAWLERLLSVGIVATDPDIVRRQRCVNVGAYATAANAASHLVFNVVYDFQGLIPVHVYNVAMIVLPLLIPRLHRYGENVGAIALAFLILVAHMFVVWAMGIASDLHVYYTMAPAFLLLIGVQHWRLFLAIFVLSLAALLFALNYAPIDGFVSPEDRALRDLLSTHAMVNTITINAIVIFYALSALRRADLSLQYQFGRSDALIAAVMPAPIAERLKSGEERIADRIETLSVMFADLVGFTESVHHLPPEEVVDFLDRLVRDFDGLSERYGVEKIKTIGDSYMAAAGFDGRGQRGRGGDRPARAGDAGGHRPPAAAWRPRAAIADRDPLRPRDRRRHRRHALLVRRVGRCGELRGAHGIERRARQDPCERGFPRADARPLRIRGRRHHRAEGHRYRAQLFPVAREGVK